MASIPEDETGVDETLAEPEPEAEPEPVETSHLSAEVSALPVLSGDRGLVPYDALRRYLAEIRQIERLTPEEEHELAVRFHETGDVQAAYRLTTSHLRLVVRIAFEFKRSWLNLLDLIQEGNLGLLLALRKFDPFRGIRLSTYASWWIRAYIIKFLLDNWRMVRVGTTNARRKLLFNLRKEKEALEAQGVVPTSKLLAERMDVTEQDVIEVDRSLGMSDTSLDAPAGPESDRSLADLLPSQEMPVDQQVEERERAAILKAKFAEFEATLKPRERVVFRERMLAEEPATLEALGTRFQMTREGLRQVEKRIARDLKVFLSREVPDFRSMDVRQGHNGDGPAAGAAQKPAKKSPAKRSKPRRPASQE